MKKISVSVILLLRGVLPFAQSKELPVIHAVSTEAKILDGAHVSLNWHLDPSARPDIYYVNVPGKPGTVTLLTDKGKISFDTRFGSSYDLVVLLKGRDSCFIRIMADYDRHSQWLPTDKAAHDTIPFTLKGSRIYVEGVLNNKHVVNMQLDLGAGTNCVNKTSAEKLALLFDRKTMVSNTEGVIEMPVSSANTLSFGKLSWASLPLTQVGNMQKEEDLIIGNTLFRNKVLEIDYDRMILVVHNSLPAPGSRFKKQPVWYEQSRPRFEATLNIEGTFYPFWFLFDTGREGTMLIGEDFTGTDSIWSKLNPLTIINGRKIVRLNAVIAGVTIPDIVTNAADPANPGRRPTLFGNQVLNHFNVILDNIHGDVYLAPNGRRNEPYSDYPSYLRNKKE